MSKNFIVTDLPLEERPRERLANLGAEALSIQELLAIILSRGIAGESVITTSQKLLSTFGSLAGIKEASLQDLQNIKGLGFAKACQIKACLEIANRLDRGQSVNEDCQKNKQKSVTPNIVYKLVKKKIGGYAKEHFIVVSLDIKSKVLGIDEISTGTLTSSLVHPRETLEAAIRRHAANFIVAHNHPSGDPEPSDEDTKVTKLLFEAGQVMGITMLDHMIIGKGNYFSFRENRVM